MSKKILALMLSLVFMLSGCDMLGGQATAAPPLKPPELEESAITAQGRLVPRQTVQLAFATGGRVAQVLAAEGDVVRKGQSLVRLENQAALDAALAAAEFELSNARQARQALRDNLETERNQALAALNLARQALRAAEQRVDDLENSKDDELVSLAETDLEIARENVRLAEKRYNQLRVGADPELVKAAEARITNAEAQLAAARAALASLTLTAPQDGTLAALDVAAGGWVAPGMPVVQLADFSQWFVETEDLTEIDVVRVSSGQAVTVTPDALPGVTLTGAVTAIRLLPAERFGDITYTVRIALQDADPRLRWGMTVTVTFGE